MSRVLVLGATGFIGRRVLPALENLGHEAMAGSRSSPAFSADRRDPASVHALMRREACDTLIDMIAYDGPSTARLHERLHGSIARYVLISSSDVYRRYGALHRREPDAEGTGLLDEASPLRTSRYPYRGPVPRAGDAADAWMDTYEKIDAEDAVAGPQTSIVRLPMVFGPGDKQSRFAWITQPMRAGAPDIAAPAAWLDWTTTYGHVDNVAHAIGLCATHPGAGGRIFNCGDEPVSHRVWIARFAACLGWPGVVTENDAAPISRAIGGLDLSQMLRLDTARMRESLDYAPAISLSDSLRSVV